MCLVFARLLSLPHSHIVPDSEAPTGASATSRPKNCQLDTTATESFCRGIEYSLFEEWWAEYFNNGGAKSYRAPE